MKTVLRWSWAALLIFLVLPAACGGGSDSGVSSDESYDEGSVKMNIETLDTGLLKGHSYANAAQGFTVEKVHVAAVDQKQKTWPVIEIPEETAADKATLFFEVTIQELPRGNQVTITTTTTFKNSAGVEVERTAADIWPP